MNKIKGIIKNTITSDNLTLIEIDVLGVLIKSIVVDNPIASPYIKVNSKVNVLFKETEVILGNIPSTSISIENSFLCKIKNIKNGKLLNEVTLNFNATEIGSIITTTALKRMQLVLGQEVTAYVKINEIIIAED